MAAFSPEHEPEHGPPDVTPPPEPPPAPPEPAEIPPAVHPQSPPFGTGEPPVPTQDTPVADKLFIDGVAHVPAGLWWRIGAFLIDAVILGIAHQIMLHLIQFPAPDVEQYSVMLERMLAEFTTGGALSNDTFSRLAVMQRPLIFAGWLNVCMCGAYFTVFHGMLGATLGKLSLGLTVRRRDGSPLGWNLALLRYLCYLLVAKLLYTAWLIPFNRERRTLYDIVLGTNVYRSV